MSLSGKSTVPSPPTHGSRSVGGSSEKFSVVENTEQQRQGDFTVENRALERHSSPTPTTMIRRPSSNPGQRSSRILSNEEVNTRNDGGTRDGQQKHSIEVMRGNPVEVAFFKLLHAEFHKALSLVQYCFFSMSMICNKLFKVSYFYTQTILVCFFNMKASK